MKEIKQHKTKNPLKKLFIKICRLMGYEIIDQSNFYIPTSEKSMNETLSKPGLKSINLPLGEVNITRKVKSLDVIIRSCSSVNMLTQNKKRIFEKNKIEYTLRSINSILKSVSYSKKYHPDINIKIIVVDHNSSLENLEKIKNLLNSSTTKFKLLNLDITEFESEIKKTNEKDEKIKPNQISNMSNIYKSLLLSKSSEDLVYFVEDDYIHKKESLGEMIFTYEKIASNIGRELFLCPVDYPYLYKNIENTNIVIGHRYHWRTVKESLLTFLTSKEMINKHWEGLVKMCTQEHSPFETPLHQIYENEICLSPVPSLAMHCTNVNSIFGLSPNINIKKIWEENKV